MKISAHFRAALTAAIVVFVGYMIKQPQMVAWLQAHWLVSDLLTGTGMAYGVYTAYADPAAPPPPPVTSGSGGTGPAPAIAAKGV
jgi:hypothetical protein